MMTTQSEYMEAFFGVELNKKFEDMINELREIEENLKELSKDMAKLGGKISPEEFNKIMKECRAAAYEHAQQVKDIRTFLEFYLKSEKNVTHIVLERDAYMKIYQIFKWDGADVRDLKRWIVELREICDKIGLNIQDLVNFRKLTAKPVPDDLVKFPVYALDRQGYCLTGASLDIVMHIDEVREKMQENSQE
jgi:septation ring formation regulator EzrA